MLDSQDNLNQRSDLGIVIVDHGSRRGESNAMLEAAVEEFRKSSSLKIVEPAHMELAEPSIATAFDRCVAQGAKTVVVFPYFLLPGRHWDQDIPRLAGSAASKHPGVRYLVTAPFALHPLMTEIARQRIEHCLARSLGDASACEFCEGQESCQLRIS
jgi:sirohydrochlorin ferrochelatase